MAPRPGSFWSVLGALFSGRSPAETADNGARRAFEDAGRRSAPFAEALRARPLPPGAEAAFRSHQRVFPIPPVRDGRPPWQAGIASRARAAAAFDMAVQGRVHEALAALGDLADWLAGNPGVLDGMEGDPGRLGHRMTPATVCMGAGAIGYLIDDETSAAWYARAFALDDSEVSVATILGVLLLRLGRPADATSALSRALDLRRAEATACEEAARKMGGRGPLESLMTAREQVAEIEDLLAQARRARDA